MMVAEPEGSDWLLGRGSEVGPASSEPSSQRVVWLGGLIWDHQSECVCVRVCVGADDPPSQS